MSSIYNRPLALLTDLYQLTMAYSYWKTGVQDRQAVFHLSFRENPFRGGFTIAAGLATAIDFLENFRFIEDDLDYLSTVEGNDGRPLFEPDFLGFLHELSLECDIDAVPEGTVVFPHEPLVRVTGPLLQAQILETALLNVVNFQTLIATKAARVAMAAQGDPVLEFGLRRAQGIDGAISASRAAYIGGCAATSNVLAGRLFNIPVRGTHAHSWVMCFDDEMEAFEAYAEAMPNNCVFLVDTYDTLAGVRRACDVGQELRRRGHEMVGIRLDSGDLAELSIRARQILDKAGFPEAAIVASNDLDEKRIADLKNRGATINVWGVGTRLATGHDQPALGGVYKLSAIRDSAPSDKNNDDWQYKLKLSEEPIKVSNPGILQVRRFFHEGEATGDVIYDEPSAPTRSFTLIDQADSTRRKEFLGGAESEDLLVPVFRNGRRVYDVPTATDARARTLQQLELFHHGVTRRENPYQYAVGLEESLHRRKTELIMEARGYT